MMAHCVACVEGLLSVAAAQPAVVELLAQAVQPAVGALGEAVWSWALLWSAVDGA